jgi:hypothetical protein
MRDQLFTLFLCPYCNKYTIHMPRLTIDGNWVVDHTLIERVFYKHANITIPLRWCKISAIALTNGENFTRTVIRV